MIAVMIKSKNIAFKSGKILIIFILFPGKLSIVHKLKKVWVWENWWYYSSPFCADLMLDIELIVQFSPHQLSV